MSRSARISSLGTLLALLVVTPVLLPSAPASLVSDVEDAQGGPPAVVCGGTAYTRIFQAIHAGSGSYFALYGSPLGDIAVKWLLDSNRVIPSSSAAGVALSTDLPDAGSFATDPGFSGRQSLQFSTSDLGFYGSCALPIGRLQPQSEYYGRLDGVVEQLTTRTSVDCEIITDTKMSGGFLYLFIFGYGWVRSTQSAQVVCSTDVSSKLQPHRLFGGGFFTTFVPGSGFMVCLEGGSASGATCASPTHPGGLTTTVGG